MVVLIVVVVPFTVKSPPITKSPLIVSPLTFTYRVSSDWVTWSELLIIPSGMLEINGYEICDEPLTIPLGNEETTPFVKWVEPVSKVKVAAPIKEPPLKPLPAFTSVISPADAAIILASTYDLTAPAVPIELGVPSSIELDTWWNAAVPSSLEIISFDELFNKTVNSLPLGTCVIEFNFIPLNIGVSVDCKPKSTSSKSAPFIVALRVPCDGDEYVEPLTTFNEFKWVVLSLSSYCLIEP